MSITAARAVALVELPGAAVSRLFIPTSGSFSAEVLVRSPRKLGVFIIYKKKNWIKVSRKSLCNFETRSTDCCAGAISIARSNDPNSGGSSFFVMLGAAPHLDMQYSVFGCDLFFLSNSLT